MYPAGYIEIHASACGERFVHEHKEFANIQPLLIIVISKAAVIEAKLVSLGKYAFSSVFLVYKMLLTFVF